MRELAVAAILSASLTSMALADDDALEIVLTVTGAEPEAGQILVSLFDSPADFLVTPIREVTIDVDEAGNASVTLGDLKNGDYAIAVIYDENENGKLDTGLFRIPKEKVGFSNNARGRFGPAKWADAHFTVTDSDVSVEIRLAKADSS